MSLAQQEDIEFIKQPLSEWLTEVSLGKPPAVYEIELNAWYGWKKPSNTRLIRFSS